MIVHTYEKYGILLQKMDTDNLRFVDGSYHAGLCPV